MFERGLVRAIALSTCIVGIPGCATLTPNAANVHSDQYTRQPLTSPATPAPATPNQMVGPDRVSSQEAADEIREADRLVYFDRRVGSHLSGRAVTGDLAGRTLRLNFTNAPVAEVVQAVVGDALGQTVMVADGVDGRISLTSPEPAPALAALAALETVLAESNLVLAARESGFLLARLSDSQPSLNGNWGELGYGGRVVSVRHTAPSAIISLIEPFLSDRVEAVPHDDLGILILAGPGSDIDAARNAVETFDRPLLTDRIVGLFELRFVSAETAESEIDTVLAGLGISPQSVQTIAMPRLNMLLISAREESQFEHARGWIERFDRPSAGSERRLRYHLVNNTPATTLATQITAAFAGGQTGDGAVFEPRFADDSATASSEEASQAGRLAIIPDELNNALIIRATDQEYREIIDLVERMDVMPPQVLIEATIAEVRLADGLDFGVRWFFENSNGSQTSTASFSDSTTGGTDPTFPGFNYAFSGTDITATLSALRSITDVTILSAPSIMVQNNQTAHLQVGDEVPIVTQTATSVSESNAPIVSSVELRETGVILQVTPRINVNGMVVLEVNQEVSSVRPTTTSGIDSPTIQKLEFTSTVSVRSSSTIALGGLIRQSQSDNEARIPLLGDMPAIGNIFRSRGISSERTELVIFLTPRIIQTEAESSAALLHVRRQLEALEARQPDLFDR
ncbi:type II secretion system secretin GspD [Maricaulis sp.]|uniref:type II secretion system secretin GspD n=1 Tax=Maricaulis sp. TaxID=1486257 RepID=UPI002B26D48A|nr:type II secretion system secretin GspD [Maricaulis sp.]